VTANRPTSAEAYPGVPRQKTSPAPSILLGVVLLNLFVIGLAANAVHSSWRNNVERARTATENMAMVLERGIADIFDNTDLALKNLSDEYAESLRTRQYSDARWNATLRRQGAYLPILRRTRGIDAQGIARYGLEKGEPQNVNLADRDYFSIHRDNPNAGLLISQPVMTRITRTWSVTVTRRLNDANGNFSGIVAIAIPLERFRELFATLELGERGAVSMRDDKLRLIVRRPVAPNAGIVGSSRIADEFAAALKRNPAMGSYQGGTGSIDGVRRFSSYRHNAAYGFYVNVGVADDEYFARWWIDSALTIAITLMFLLTTVYFSLNWRRMWGRQRSMTARLRSSEGRFRKMFQLNDSVMLLIEPHSGSIVDANAAAESFYGYPSEALKTMRIDQINALPVDEIAEMREKAAHHERNFFVFPHRLASGEVRTVEVRSSPIEVEGEELLFSIVHDVTDRQELESQIRQLAFHDPLTRLPNRRLLSDRLRQVMAACRRSGCYGALMFLDLDNFKPLNDAHGHAVGDLLLIEVATRLTHCVREVDTVGRFGGDEFVVVLSELNAARDVSATQARIVAEKILASLSEPYRLTVRRDGKPDVIVEHRCTATIGVTLFIDHETTQDDILKWADSAMYAAKARGRNSILFHETKS